MTSKSGKLRRVYNFSDADLVQAADSLKISLERDLADLAVFSVTSASLDVLQDYRDQFADYAQDVYHVGLLKGAVYERNLASDAVVSQFREVEAIVRNVADIPGYKVDSLNIRELTKMKASELVQLGKNVERTLTSLAADLAGTAINPAYITAMMVKVQDLDDKIDEVQRQRKDREQAAMERVELGNRLYKEMVKLADFGKTKWYSLDESRYNDYILIETATATGNRRTLTIPENTVKNANFPDIEPDFLFSLQGDNALPVEVYFSDTPLDNPDIAPFVLLPNHTVEKTAMELGYKELAPFLNVRNTNESGTATVKITLVSMGDS